MVDFTRKHVAPQNRVLVDAKAFLNPQFADAVLFLTGGHIELLRNLMQYANRRTTWVSDYYVGYYLSPDDFDWDLIQRRVAELEYTLMGNNNVIWGYTDRYADSVTELSMPAGNSDILGAVVPEGEVWEVTGLSFETTSTSCTGVRVGYDAGATRITVNDVLTVAPSTVYPFGLDLILKEGDRCFWRFYGMTLNDDVICYAWGSKMKVPE